MRITSVVIPVILSTLSGCSQRLFSFMLPYQKHGKSRLFTSCISELIFHGPPTAYPTKWTASFTLSMWWIWNVEMCSAALLITAVHAKWEAGLKCEEKQLNHWLTYCISADWRDSLQDVLWPRRISCYMCTAVWYGYWSVLMWTDYRRGDFWPFPGVLLWLPSLNIAEFAKAFFGNWKAVSAFCV